jgi:hypothetical protein
MAPDAPSLASKLHLWVKIDDSFTTESKIIISGLQQKYWVLHEITVGATCTNSTTYKKQGTEFFEEASALNTDEAIFALKE